MTCSNITLFQESYSSKNVVEGKRASKEALQQRLSLKKADLPLVGIITRLTHQKGIHLIKHAIWRTLERGGQVFLYFYFISKCERGSSYARQSLARSWWAECNSLAKFTKSFWIRGSGAEPSSTTCISFYSQDLST